MGMWVGILPLRLIQMAGCTSAIMIILTVVSNMPPRHPASAITETIGISGGWYTPLSLMSNDKAHISYYDGTNGDLKYVDPMRRRRVTETVDRWCWVSIGY